MANDQAKTTPKPSGLTLAERALLRATAHAVAALLPEGKMFRELIAAMEREGNARIPAIELLNQYQVGVRLKPVEDTDDAARAAPKCTCPVGSDCFNRACCYYERIVPANVRAATAAPLTPLERIKLLALMAGPDGEMDAIRTLTRIVRICLDAGATAQLSELEARKHV